MSGKLRETKAFKTSANHHCRAVRSAASSGDWGALGLVLLTPLPLSVQPRFSLFTPGINGCEHLHAFCRIPPRSESALESAHFYSLSFFIRHPPVRKPFHKILSLAPSTAVFVSTTPPPHQSLSSWTFSPAFRPVHCLAEFRRVIVAYTSIPPPLTPPILCNFVVLHHVRIAAAQSLSECHSNGTAVAPSEPGRILVP